jgi:phosphoadenosine phosphosulfate reductase
VRGLTPTDLPDLEALGVDEVIAEAGARHGAGLVLLCSFQKEESVLVDAVSRVAPQTRIVTIDTGVLFPETITAWKAFEDRFGVQVEVQDASRAGNPWTGPEDCCGTAKVAALERALDGASAWITGIRREQAPTRANTQKLEWDAKRGIPKYNPLADWTDQALWAHIATFDLPYHELHDAGYASIGCAPCTQPGDGREGRWAGQDKTECGLHVSADADIASSAGAEHRVPADAEIG